MLCKSRWFVGNSYTLISYKTFVNEYSSSFCVCKANSTFILKLMNNKMATIAVTGPEKFTFFYRAASPFSQFHPAKFQAQPLFITTSDDEKGYTFHHCEQWMMFNKAKLFKDEQAAVKILATTAPIKCKALGRKVTNFNENIWKQENERIVLEGNRLKFMQNPDLLQKLLETEGTTLVEASPSDRLYGIGLSANDARSQNRNTWRGRNVLGEVLTKLREELITDKK